MEIKEVSGGVCAPKGFKAGGVHCGIRKNPLLKDLALIVSEVSAKAAGVYTQNKTKAAPLLVTHNHLENGMAQAIICNSGNANACNTTAEQSALEMCRLAATALNIEAQDVLVASTGVIGKNLDTTPIKNGIDSLVTSLSGDSEGSDFAAQAIMTTDTMKKEIAVELDLSGGKAYIGGICKGSGMIHPNMATMLGFITTDISIDQVLLQKALSQIVGDSFNMISVDGDTSTNDMVVVLANGLAGNSEVVSEDSADYGVFFEGLKKVCLHLAVSIAKDGEGATKLLECRVSGAESDATARSLAKSVITSSLFKAAMFGADANWGRVLCALGYADVPFEPETTTVSFQSDSGEVLVCKDGLGVPFSEEFAKKVLSENKIIIVISVGTGKYSAVAWGCDLTYDYVKINGDYRS